MNINIVGLQYGDEAKGRLSAYYGQKHNASWYMRYNGGCNAGHTVYLDGIKHALHHLPAGAIFNKNVALDTGMVIDLARLKEEIKNNNVNESNLFISENVHMILPQHVEQDKEGSGFGTTKRGIAYVYSDRALKKGLRVTQEQLDKHNIKACLYRGLAPIYGTTVLESAQGALLDVDYGFYPFTTSSSVLPSSAYKIDLRVGVLKAFTSRVGEGPPFNRPIVEGLAEKGDEYGTTTGRKRRCYWNDIDELKYAVSVIQPDEMVMTKIDVLSDMEISVWENYKEVKVGNLDSYINLMLEKFPKIKYLSNSPQGDLIKC